MQIYDFSPLTAFSSLLNGSMESCPEVTGGRNVEGDITTVLLETQRERAIIEYNNNIHLELSEDKKKAHKMMVRCWEAYLAWFYGSPERLYWYFIPITAVLVMI